MDKPKILVVDDEPALAGLVAHAARRCGYDVVVTTGMSRFCEEYLAQRPDLIATDLGIPDGDGVEILRFLSDNGCTAPIIIISGFDRRTLDSAFSLGEDLGLLMVGPLMKPVRLQELDALLRNHLPH